MSAFVLNARSALGLVVCGALAVFPSLGCAFEDIGLMTQQPKYEAYEPSPLFKDGRAMREPPVGTVPAEYRSLSPEMKRYRLTPADALGKPQFVANNPLPLTRQMLDTGRHNFNVYCAPCHGLTGDGKSIVGENMPARPPPSLIPYKGEAPGRLYAVITEGFGFMSSYASYLTVEERWSVVAYLDVLQKSQSVVASQAPAEWRAKASAAVSASATESAQ